MAIKEIYIIISIIVLLVIAYLVYTGGEKKSGLTLLDGLAFSFAIAGIVFGDSRFVGYSLIGTGIILAVVDILRISKQGEDEKRYTDDAH